MIYSMTGYSSLTRTFTEDCNKDSIDIFLELRTVNSRFLDISFRIPDEMHSYEFELRNILNKYISRGRIDVKINLNYIKKIFKENILSDNVLQNLFILQEKIHAQFPKAKFLSIAEILKWPDVIYQSNSKFIYNYNLHKEILSIFKYVVKDIVLVRKREGKKLGIILLQNISKIELIIENITLIIPKLIIKYQQKIANRLEEILKLSIKNNNSLLKNSFYEETKIRIQQEISIYVNKIDIMEEISRIKIHLSELRYVIKKGGKIGKKIDFLIQEINREINTLNSKSVSQECSNASINIKLLIEQMREQVQNIE